MRYLLTIIAFILFIEAIDFIQFFKWAATDKSYILSDHSEAEGTEEQKTEEQYYYSS